MNTRSERPAAFTEYARDFILSEFQERRIVVKSKVVRKYLIVPSLCVCVCTHTPYVCVYANSIFVCVYKYSIFVCAYKYPHLDSMSEDRQSATKSQQVGTYLVIPRMYVYVYMYIYIYINTHAHMYIACHNSKWSRQTWRTKICAKNLNVAPNLLQNADFTYVDVHQDP